MRTPGQFSMLPKNFETERIAQFVILAPAQVTVETLTRYSHDYHARLTKIDLPGYGAFLYRYHVVNELLSMPCGFVEIDQLSAETSLLTLVPHTLYAAASADNLHMFIDFCNQALQHLQQDGMISQNQESGLQPG
jgi:hypothetical protein